MLTIKTYIHILLLLTIYSPIITNIEHNSLPVFVSLGKDCEPAKMLRKLELRTEAYPFDWNNTTQFSGIFNMIIDNFKDFLNPLFLQHNGRTILDTRYTIEFRHDFPSLTPYGDTGVGDWDLSPEPYHDGLIVNNFLDFLPIIIEKYTRRINRFIELLNSTKKVIFIRTHLTPEEAKEFTTLMSTYYPKLEYQLIGLQKDKCMALEFQQIPSVKVYYTQTKHSHIGGWIQPEEWHEIMADVVFNNK